MAFMKIITPLILSVIFLTNGTVYANKKATEKPEKARSFFRLRDRSKQVFSEKDRAALAHMSQNLFGKVTTIERVMESPKFAPYLKSVLSKGTNRIGELESKAIYIMSRVISGKEKESESFDALVSTMVNFGERPDAFLKQDVQG